VAERGQRGLERFALEADCNPGERIGRLTCGKLRLLEGDKRWLIQLQPASAGQAEGTRIKPSTDDDDCRLGSAGQSRAEQVIDDAVTGDIGCIRSAKVAEGLEESPRFGRHEPLGVLSPQTGCDAAASKARTPQQ
jgi:hypothetical protein